MADMHYTHEMGGEGYDGQQDASFPPSNTLKNMTNFAGAAVSLALIAGLSVWGYKLVMRDVSGIPVVRAAEGEMRVRPADPGGQLARNTGAPPQPAPAPAPGAEPTGDLKLTEVDSVEDAAKVIEQQRAWKYSPGEHFTQLTSAQGTADGTSGIEVLEVFWYGCPHCFTFDPIVKNWKSDLPSDVTFVRLPVMWNPTNEIHARMYYTAEALGKLDDMHMAFFNALHRDGQTLTRENDIRSFFGKFGVSEDDFDKAFRSFAVESKLKRARTLTQRYRISSVPVMVVDGKYVVTGPGVKSYDDMLSVADELVARERVEL